MYSHYDSIVGKDRKFIIQPSQQVIDEALEGKNDLGEAIKGIFGGGNDDAKLEASVESTSVETVSSSDSSAPVDDGEVVKAEEVASE